MHRAFADVRQWSNEQIQRECGSAYRSYERALREHYIEYFHRHPQLRCANHRFCAGSVATALPPGYAQLLQRIPKGSLHRFARSAKSSQIIGLALLGVAAEHDPSFSWFWPALKLPLRLNGQRTYVRFEQALAPTDLSEVPRTTQIDITVSNENAFFAIETKWSEPGFPTCSCEREGTGNPGIGFDCAERVYARTAYWRTANRFLKLPEARLSFEPCFLSIVYQIVRNIAAACHLSRGRTAGFILLYDCKNPFFQRTGNWPGWPDILTALLRKQPRSNFYFRAASWQAVIDKLPLNPAVRDWARDKHRL
jgi:hypothetical protein